MCLKNTFFKHTEYYWHGYCFSLHTRHRLTPLFLVIIEGTLAGSPTESKAILLVNRSERGDVISVKVESNKDLQVYLNTESGMGVPFELINLGENEIFISPYIHASKR